METVAFATVATVATGAIVEIIWKPKKTLPSPNFVRDCSGTSDGSDYIETGLYKRYQ